jgi:voltage-gated potassium channel
MTDLASRPKHEQDKRWDALDQLDAWLRIPMLVLSVIWLVLVLIEFTWGNFRALEAISIAIWAIFILEFLLRFALAPEKLEFLRRNWITMLVLVVPALRIFRTLRFLETARGLRGFRLLQVVETANHGMNALRASMRRRGLGYVLGITVVVILLGAAGMLALEPASQVPGGFKNYGDALWWTAMLLTSIGSQFWPVTAEGRILGFALALYGFMVFGYITASFASFFVGRDAASEEAEIAGAPEIAGLRAEIAALRAELRQAS